MDEYENIDIIEGTVASVLFSNEENGYTVVRINGDIVVGCFPDVLPGEKMICEGVWVEHPNFGKQFKAETVTRFLPNDCESIFTYLASGAIRGLGVATATQIVNLFGEDSLDIIENDPLRLTEIKGISKSKAVSFSDTFKLKTFLRRLIELLSDYNIRPFIAMRLYNLYGSDALSKVRENPYLISYPEIGGSFAEADNMALDMGFEENSKFRIKAAIIFELNHNLLNGHCFIPKDSLIKATYNLISAEIDRIETCVDELAISGDIVKETIKDIEAVYLPHIYEAETYVAKRLSSMKDRVQIITGGPGTGKTTSIIKLLDKFDELNCKVLLVAPTGRAAKRITEVTHREASTIHRLLGVKPQDEAGKVSFVHNEDDKLNCDAVILDESSMVDILIMEALLKALPNDAKLIMVGDVDQLPPVGPGYVFKSMIESECFHTVKLTEIFRQSNDSMIVKNAHIINKGQIPDFSLNSGDFFRLRRLEAASAVETVVELCSKRLPEKMNIQPADIQVLSPSRRGELGTVNLNAKLQEALNPHEDIKKEHKYGDRIFREGDRVMQIRNDYDIIWHNADFSEAGCGIFNGDVGYIKTIDLNNEVIDVDFDGKITSYGFGLLNELEHAWAITVHKAQGCEFKAVVLALSNFSRLLMTRDVLYTAVTRAKDLLIIVGNEKDAVSMIENGKKGKRFTFLKYRLKKFCS